MSRLADRVLGRLSTEPNAPRSNEAALEKAALLSDLYSSVKPEEFFLSLALFSTEKEKDPLGKLSEG